MKTKLSLIIVVTLICLARLPKIQAVSPPPDGGYANFTTAEGTNALLSLTTGSANTGVGWFSLKSDSIGSFNTGVGAGTLLLNTADQNTATGAGALLSNTTGPFNTADGVFALFSNTTGSDNTADGDGALSNNTIGSDDTAIGVSALVHNTTGSNNIAIGSFAGAQQTTGSNNVYIGVNMQGAEGESNACYIASIFDQASAGGTPVLINLNNRLGTITSSRRFKEDISPMGKASQELFSLKPVSFHYKKAIDPARTPQLGLVAEDVEKVNPALVVRDKEGKPYSVRYDQINAMLLNEFLKEHQKVDGQQKQIDALTIQLKQQESRIQKISDQLETTSTTQLADTRQ